MNYSIFPFDGGPPIGHTAGRNVRVAPVCIPSADKPYGVVLTPNPPCNFGWSVSFEWRTGRSF